MSALTEVTAPTEYPVTVAEIKEHLRIDGNEDNAVLEAYIAAATEQAQTWCNRQFITATYDWFTDWFPRGSQPFRVPRAPLASVTSLKYIDENGAQQTWTGSNYRVDTDTAPGRITEAYDVVWPTTRSITNAVEIQFVCGYGAASAVPVAVKHALKMMVGDLYENREAAQLTTFSFKSNPAVESLLSTVRLLEFV